MVDEVLSGYDIVSPLEEAELSRLYHARRREDDADVVLRHVAAGGLGEQLAAGLADAERASRTADACVDPVRLLEGSGGRVVLLAETGPGESLRRRLENGPMPVGWALEVAAAAAAALGAVHRVGLVHGALTPAELWLRPSGGVRLLGLGLHPVRGTLRPEELLARSAAYTAPEVLRGGGPTPASDVWSLAVILFEMITGRRAFPGDDAAAVRAAVLGEGRPALGGVRTGIGPELERFLGATLERDPEVRIGDMGRVGDVLGAMSDLLTEATEVSPEALTADGTRTNPAALRRRPFRAPVSAGDTVGGFQVLEQLGRGGMGLVYRGRDRRLGRQVALKFLPENLDDDQPADRFLQEAKAASALDHPNICTIYGVDETPSGDVYIAMALYDGPSVKDLLESGPLPVVEALRIAIHVTSGLVAAHERGIVHCDIKPGNVVLAEDGTAKIVDFGISRMAHLTYVDGAGFVGTAGYAAPEQVWRRPFDHRVDLWAVGVLLYEMLTGERPFPGHGMKALMATVEEEPAPPSERVAGLPPVVDEVVARCLARDPDERYGTATDLLLDLQRAMAEVSGDGAPARPGRRRALGWGLAAVGVVVAAAGWLAPRLGPAGGEDPGRRVVMLGVVAGDAAGGVDVAEPVEELLRFELSSAGGIRLVEVAPGAGDASARGRIALEPGSLAAVAGDHGAEMAAVALVHAAGPEASAGIVLELRLQPASASEPAAVAEARGPPGRLLEMASEAVEEAAAAAGIGLPARSPDTDWRPFATAEAATLHADAVRRLQVLDSIGARPLLERALEIEPANPVLEMTLADVLFDLGRESEAAERARRAVAHAAGAPRALRLLAHGRALEAARESGRAAAAYRALDLAGPGCAMPGEPPVDGAVRLATALVRGSLPLEALEVVERTASGDGSDPRLDLVRAEAYHWLGRHDPQLEAAERAVAIARREGLAALEARALRLLASARWRLGRLDDGLAALDESRRLYDRLGHDKGQADIDAMTGVLLYEKGELWQAKASYDRAARRYGSLGNRRAEARTLTNKALVLEQQGDLDATIDVTREAVRLFRESDDGVAELIALVNLSSALRSRGRLDEAGEALAAAVEKMRTVSRFEAWTLLHAADLHLARGELAEATAALARAAELQEERGDALGRALSTARAAHVLRLQGEAAEACRLFEQAMPVLAERATTLDHAAALRDFGAALRVRGELERSDRVLRRALEIQSSVTTRAGRSRTQLGLAATLREGGLSDDAEGMAREALADLELRGQVVGVARARALLARLALDRGDLDSAASEVARGRATLAGVAAPEPRMELELVALRIEAGRGAAGVREDLQSLLAEATSRGYVELGLEVMLALGEQELAAGAAAAGRARLEGAIADASLKGLRSIADRARRVLDASRS